MQQVLACDWSSRSCNMYYIIYTWIELHIPVELQLMEVIEVLLQNLGIFLAEDCQVNDHIIRKQPYLDRRFVREVIYVNEKE